MANRTKVTLPVPITIDGNLLGELLRSLTFVGEGVGCLHNFEVRQDAQIWDRERVYRELYEFHYTYISTVQEVHGAVEKVLQQVYGGCTYSWGEVEVDAMWYFDDTPVLCFRIRQGDQVLRAVISTDRERNDVWEDNLYWPVLGDASPHRRHFSVVPAG